MGPAQMSGAARGRRKAVWLTLCTLHLAACADARGLVLGAPGQSGDASALRDATASDTAAADSSASDMQGDAAAAGDAGLADAGLSGIPEWARRACTPPVQYENSAAADDLEVLEQAIVAPVQLAQQAARRACATLYRSAEEVPVAGEIALVLENFDGVAAATGNQRIRVSSSYLSAYAREGGDVRRELEGILHFAMANIYQHDGDGTAPGWLVTGVADYVRLAAGLGAAQPRTGGSWQDGYQTAAGFFAWIVEQHPDFIYRLNQRLSPEASMPYADAWFVELAVETLPALWARYQADLQP